MNNKINIFLICGTLFAVCIGVTLYWWSSMESSSLKVVAISPYAVLYEDNSAEFLFRDELHGKLHTYRTPVEPLYIDEKIKDWGWGVFGSYMLPELRMIGGNHDHVIFTYEYPTSSGTHIVYMDRSAHTTHTAYSPLSITKALDQKDYTHFWAQRFSWQATEQSRPGFVEVGVGRYRDGSFVATTSIEIPVQKNERGEVVASGHEINPLDVVADWELDNIVFAFSLDPECGEYTGVCDTSAFIYHWNLQTGEVRDVTPAKGVSTKLLHQYLSPTDTWSNLQYIRDYGADVPSGKFIILGDGGYDDPYAVISLE